MTKLTELIAELLDKTCGELSCDECNEQRNLAARYLAAFLSICESEELSGLDWVNSLRRHMNE